MTEPEAEYGERTAPRVARGGGQRRAVRGRPGADPQQDRPRAIPGGASACSWAGCDPSPRTSGQARPSLRPVIAALKSGPGASCQIRAANCHFDRRGAEVRLWQRPRAGGGWLRPALAAAGAALVAAAAILGSPALRHSGRRHRSARCCSTQTRSRRRKPSSRSPWGLAHPDRALLSPPHALAVTVAAAFLGQGTAPDLSNRRRFPLDVRSANWPGQRRSHACRRPQAGPHDLPDRGAGTHTNTTPDIATIDVILGPDAHALADTVRHAGHTGLCPSAAGRNGQASRWPPGPHIAAHVTTGPCGQAPAPPHRQSGGGTSASRAWAAPSRARPAPPAAANPARCAPVKFMVSALAPVRAGGW